MDMTFNELVDYVEENFGGEVVNQGRRKEILIHVPLSEFEEENFYDLLPDWDGNFDEKLDDSDENFGAKVIVYTGLFLDPIDKSTLVPIQVETDDVEEELEEDEEDEEDWVDEDSESDDDWLF